MKLITLNIWGGHVLQPLLAFLKAHQDIDVFCFQEVYHHASKKVSRDDRIVYLDIFTKIQTVLPNHRGYFRPAISESYGIAVFAANTVNVIDEGDIWIHKTNDYSGMGPAHCINITGH